MNKKKGPAVPKELAHLSDEELNELVAQELEDQDSFRSDKAAGLPANPPDGYDPTVDINTQIHHDFMHQGKGVLSRIANRDMPDKVIWDLRNRVLPTEEEISDNIHSFVRPTPREADYWKMFEAYRTRPAVDSVLQKYNYPAALYCYNKPPQHPNPNQLKLELT